MGRIIFYVFYQINQKSGKRNYKYHLHNFHNQHPLCESVGTAAAIPFIPGYSHAVIFLTAKILYHNVSHIVNHIKKHFLKH
ncbi:MAG: hypothetical protein Q4E87_08205, partial [bacterium]|nr:hypothetical protein [bacterium]